MVIGLSYSISAHCIHVQSRHELTVALFFLLNAYIHTYIHTYDIYIATYLYRSPCASLTVIYHPLG